MDPVQPRGHVSAIKSRYRIISEGKLEGDIVSFTVVRKTPNGENKGHYHGKISGDKIAGKIETERNGEKQSREWEAKRQGK